MPGFFLRLRIRKLDNTKRFKIREAKNEQIKGENLIFFRSGLHQAENPLFCLFQSFICLVYPFVVFVLLFLNWVVFSGKFDAFHLGLGVVSCLVVTWLSHDLLYLDRSKRFLARVREAWGFICYIPWLTWEVVLANVHVLKLAMTKAGYVEMSPRVVTFKTKLKTDFAKFVLANSITLTPGTITMLIRGDVFHIHVMSQYLEDDLLTGAIEMKVLEIFEPELLNKG